MFLYLNDSTNKREKLSFNLFDAFRVLATDGHTISVQRGDVIEKVARSRCIDAPSSLVSTPRGSDATPADFHAKTKGGRKWIF